MIKYQTVKTKMADFQRLYTRNDKDRNLYNLKKFELTGWDKKNLEHVINVTFNDARVFGDRIISLCIGSDMQTVIEGKKVSLMPEAGWRQDVWSGRMRTALSPICCRWIRGFYATSLAQTALNGTRTTPNAQRK